MSNAGFLLSRSRDERTLVLVLTVVLEGTPTPTPAPTPTPSSMAKLVGFRAAALLEELELFAAADHDQYGL